jgi:integrase
MSLLSSVNQQQSTKEVADVARITKRIWYSKSPTGQRQKRVAWGWTAQGPDGKQIKRANARWTREDAERSLAEHRLGIAPAEATAGITLGQAVERYLQAKSRKRSLENDRRFLKAFTEYFGTDTPLAKITAGRVSAWKGEKLAGICPQTGRPYSPAGINRPLATLRHLLQLAHDEWELLPAVPRIRLEKEPQGRVRWLEPDEEARLLEACRANRNSQLASMVIMALETGLRKSELLGLTWDRIDLSRGVIRLEVTKSGRRREVPMRQAVYDVLASMPGPHTGRVWRQRKLRNSFESAVEAAKLDSPFRFHDCRHHFASWFMMRGGQLQALKELLGHSDIKTTMIYAHLSPAHLRSEMAKTERPADQNTANAGARFRTKSEHELSAADQSVGSVSATS